MICCHWTSALVPPGAEYASFTRPGTDQCTANLSPAKLAAYKASQQATSF